MSLTLLYLSIYQDAQEQHGDNQIGIVQQLHKEGIWWHLCWLQRFYNYPDHWYHIAVVLICWFTHALFDKNNKIHERLTITGNKKVWAFYWVLCVTVFSSGIIFISIFIFLMLSFNSFFYLFFPDQHEGEAMEMQILGLPHPDQGVWTTICSFIVPNQVDIN